mmetsp:Transcript_27009/g.26072  ORF Transcript_27009/g.26072 Transcript_27009/m.26072 type:complete len:154 (+) Transcript_27009:465-926(+)
MRDLDRRPLPRRERPLPRRERTRPPFRDAEVLQDIPKKKIISLSKPQKKLKIRNIDENQVSNDELKQVFEKIGKLRECKFDRNEFGKFLGSASVVYEKAEDAKKAITEYHGAYLDDKVLTVEFDKEAIVRVPKVSRREGLRPGGKTLRLGARR